MQPDAAKVGPLPMDEGQQQEFRDTIQTADP